MEKICVIGSLNMDLVAVTERFLKPGETVIGKEFGTYPGGKGANQAVAAGRLQASVRMVGKVGADLFGDQQLQNLQRNGVDIGGIGIQKDTTSGIALIEVERSGENRIIVIPGANEAVDRQYIESRLPYMLECGIFLLQLEIPATTVFDTIRTLKEHGKTVILDPAPAQGLPEEIYPFVDFLTPNETELAILAGTSTATEDQLNQAAKSLLRQGVKTVILKAGQNGAYIINEQQLTHIPGFAVQAIDTTAAGDTFNAGLAVALAAGKELPECVRFANAAGALATTAKGAQTAMPTLAQLQSFIARNRQFKTN